MAKAMHAVVNQSRAKSINKKQPFEWMKHKWEEVSTTLNSTEAQI